MKSGDLDGLQNSLDRDLAWRKKEISYAKSLAMRVGGEGQFLHRALLVMLCAHWEGALKFGLKSYLSYVLAMKPRIRDLRSELVALSYYKDIRQAAEAKFPGAETHMGLAKRISGGNGGTCVFDPAILQTRGNVGTENVCRLLKSAGLDEYLGMDHAEWSTTKIFIDEQIVRDRNLIAHGEGLQISGVEFSHRSNRMTLLLDRLLLCILQSAEERRYRRGA